jgi:hypothetical protein
MILRMRMVGSRCSVERVCVVVSSLKSVSPFLSFLTPTPYTFFLLFASLTP